MGCNFLNRRCWTNTNPNVIAPNPSPNNWKLLELKQFKNAYVLKVFYHGCTNYEGVKIMVYKGQYNEGQKYLDPHFQEDAHSPIARFKPTNEGWKLALKLAQAL